jgi:hypothetical protein
MARMAASRLPAGVPGRSSVLIAYGLRAAFGAVAFGAVAFGAVAFGAVAFGAVAFGAVAFGAGAGAIS